MSYLWIISPEFHPTKVCLSNLSWLVWEKSKEQKIAWHHGFSLKDLRNSSLKASKILQHVLHLVLSVTQLSQAHQEGEIFQCYSLLWVFYTCGTLFYEYPNYPHLRKWFYTILFGVVEEERTANQSASPCSNPGIPPSSDITHRHTSCVEMLPLLGPWS